MTFRQKWQTFANSGHTGAIADREKGGRAKRLWDVGVRGGVGTRCGENNVNRKKREREGEGEREKERKMKLT